MKHGSAVRAQQLYAQGVALQQQGRVREAIGAWQDALACDTQHADARYNLAVALAASGDDGGAERSYVELLARHPEHAQALYNLANLKMRRGEAAQAEPLYRRLLSANARFTNGWINLSMARAAQGDLGEARSSLSRALALEPQNVGAHWNLANLLLASGHWEEGWKEYEWRLRRPQCPSPPVAAPDWRGDAAGPRRILVWNDQGMGDALQFARYVPQLAAKGHRVILFVQDALKTLLRSVAGVADVVGASDAVPEVDAQVPLLSLPHRLAVSDPKDSWRGPYVRAAQTMQLPRRSGCPAIGLVWASNPAHPNRALRDVALTELAPLLAIDGIDWFGLQVGDAARDIAACGLGERIHDLSPRIRDFADTAAAVASLDLVITVDTSMPHLVGAMGTPAWAMISTAREWRWSGQEERSLWYPSVRLFRQSAAGDWGEVLTAIVAGLRSGQLTPIR
jgi:hypothetical protein